MRKKTIGAGVRLTGCQHFKPERILQNRLFANPKVRVVWDTVLEEVLGTDNPKCVTGARLRNLRTGAFDAIQTDGVFVAIGHKPATELFVGQLPLTAGGYIPTFGRSTATCFITCMPA